MKQLLVVTTSSSSQCGCENDPRDALHNEHHCHAIDRVPCLPPAAFCPVRMTKRARRHPQEELGSPTQGSRTESRLDSSSHLEPADPGMLLTLPVLLGAQGESPLVKPHNDIHTPRGQSSSACCARAHLAPAAVEGIQ